MRTGRSSKTRWASTRSGSRPCSTCTRPRSAPHSNRTTPSSPTPRDRARKSLTRASPPSPRPRIKARAIIDSRLADLVEAANRNAESIDERLAARIQAMSEVLAKTASEADSIWAARGASVTGAIRARGRRPARGHRRQGRRLGRRARRAWRGRVGPNRWRRRARDAYDRPADGEPGGSADPADGRAHRRRQRQRGGPGARFERADRAVARRSGQFERSAAKRRRRRDPPLDRDDRRVAEAVDRAG